MRFDGIPTVRTDELFSFSHRSPVSWRLISNHRNQITADQTRLSTVGVRFICGNKAGAEEILRWMFHRDKRTVPTLTGKAQCNGTRRKDSTSWATRKARNRRPKRRSRTKQNTRRLNSRSKPSSILRPHNLELINQGILSPIKIPWGAAPDDCEPVYPFSLSRGKSLQLFAAAMPKR